MAIFIKSVGCECAECGPDPCTSGCNCDFSSGIIEVSVTSRTDYYDTTGQFYTDQYLSFDFSISAETQYDQFEIYADSVLIHSSGCVSSGSSGVVVIPAGTTEIEVVVTLQCSGYIDPALLFLEYQIACLGYGP